MDLTELRAFIGIFYLRGANKKNLSLARDVFCHETSPEIFQATMGYHRYYFLVSFISFDDRATRAERFKSDKYACYRVVFESLNKRNAKLRVPSEYLTIDETLFPYRGRIGLKNYNPSKPARYGLLVISICGATLPYTYSSLPYAGKPESPNSFYVPGTDQKTMYLVNNLSKFTDLSGKNITMDRYFTSVPLCEWLLKKRITLVGTMKENRIGIPPEMKNIDGREERSTQYAYNDDNGKKMMIAWIDEKKK